MADILLSFGLTPDATLDDELYSQISSAIKKAESKASKVKIGVDVDKGIKKLDTEIDRVRRNLKNWTAAATGDTAKEYKRLEDSLKDLINLRENFTTGKIDGDVFDKKFAEILSDIRDARFEIKQAEKDTSSWGASFESLFTKFSKWLTVSQVAMHVYDAIRKMTTTAIEVDTAMTELKKVTNETASTYDKFLDNAANRAKNLGATLTDVVNASASFARLGYDIDEAANLADTAIVYKNVADDIESIDVASASITSTMQAFGIEADNAMTIVDKFNEVSNNYAITSGGLGEALQRSASAMHAAGNTLDQTIAMVTAANTIVQNPESVGTTMKTISMYLRSAKTEAEAAGESTEGMAESTSKLRKEILALTGNRVDIQKNNNTFKSTYEILKELAGVWDDLSDISQANILEMIGGKRNANVTAALLDQFDLVEDIVRTSEGSYGSALEENAKYLESIQGHISQFKAAFQALSETAANGDLIKDFIDLGTGFLNTANAVISLTDSLVGLENILKIIVGYKAIDIIQDLSGGSTLFKALHIDTNTRFGSFLKGLSDRAGSGAGKWNELASSWDSAASAGANLKNVMSSLAQSANPVKLAIASVVIGYEVAMAASNAYTEYRQSLRQNFDNDVVSFKDSKKELESYKNEIISLKDVISNKTSSTSDVASANERLVEIERGLMETYGLQATGLRLVASSADDAAEAIDNLVKAEAEEALVSNQKRIDQVNDRMERVRTEDYIAEYFLIGADEFSEVQQIYESFGYEISRTFTGAKMTLKDDAEGIVDNVKLIEEALLNKRDEWAADGNYVNIEPLLKGLSAIRKESQSVLQEYGSDYNEIIEWKLASKSVKNAEGDIVKYSDLLDDVTYAQEEFNKAVSGTYTTQEEKNKAINDALTYLNDVEETISELGFTLDDIGVKNYLLDIIKSVKSYATEDIYGMFWSSANKGISEYTTAVSNLKSEQDALNSAFSDQAGSGSISPEAYKQLIGVSKEYANALEYEAGSYRINTDVANAYLDAKVTAQTLELSGKILAETKAYEDNRIELQTLTAEYEQIDDKRSKQARKIRQEIKDLEQSQSEIESTITSYKLLRAELIEMSSAYGKWKMAQSTPESGDMYDDAKTALEQIKDGLKTGKTGTDKYKASVKMLVALDDPSPKEVSKYMSKLNRYITKDSSGAKNFINDMIKSGFMHGTDGAVATWNDAWMNDGVTAEQICDALEITPSMAKAIFGELEEYHFNFNWSDRDFDMLAIKDIMSSLEAGIEKYKAEIEANPEIAPEINPADFDNFVNRAKSAFETLFTIDPEIEPMAYEKAIREFESALKEGLKLGIDLQSLGFTNELLSGLGIDIHSEDAVASMESVVATAEEIKASVIDLAAKSIGDLGAPQAAWSLQSVLAVLNEIDAFEANPKINIPSADGASTTSSSGKSSARGTMNAVGGRTLVGELGQELVVSNGRYYTVGDRGAEFVNLKRGDIVFNHMDTKRILSSMPNNKGGQALAGGTGAKKVAKFLADLFGTEPYNMYEVSAPDYKSGSEEKFIHMKVEGVTSPGMEPPPPPPGKNPGGGKTDLPTTGVGGPGSEEAKKNFEEQYKEHQHLLAMDKENTAEYLDWLEGAYKLAFEEGTEEYWKYEEEVYKGRQDIFKDSLGDKEHFISMLVADDADASTIINNYEMLIKSVEAELERAYAQGLDDNDDYVQELKDKLVDYKDEIKSINDDINEDAKDSYEDLIEYRKDMLKQELENEKDALSKRINTLQDFYDKQKDMLQDAYDEEEYLEEQADKRRIISDLEDELDMLKDDDSAYAQRRKLEIEEDLAEARGDLADFEKEHALKITQDMLDKQLELQEDALNSEIDKIDEKLEDQKGLRDQAIADLQNGDLALYEAMIAYNNIYGDGNTNTIKTMWEDAYVAMQNYFELYNQYYEGMQLQNVTGYVPIPVGQGYASGTYSATPGVHEIEEDGSEYIFKSSDGRRYRMFGGGEKVLNATATDFLYKFANSGGKILENMISRTKTALPSNMVANNRIFEIKTGDIIVHGNTTERTVSEIRRAQRENVDFILKELGRLQNR